MGLFSAVALGLYLVLVARLTLADPSAGRIVFSWANAAATQYSSGRLGWSRTEVLANVALFVPLGLLLTIVLRRAVLAAILCALLSAGIELAQRLYLPTRVPSLADVEHNALGAVLGAALALPLVLATRKQRLHIVS
jgi:glycopeptide antibiotics resistance protein